MLWSIHFGTSAHHAFCMMTYPCGAFWSLWTCHQAWLVRNPGRLTSSGTSEVHSSGAMDCWYGIWTTCHCVVYELCSSVHLSRFSRSSLVFELKPRPIHVSNGTTHSLHAGGWCHARNDSNSCRPFFACRARVCGTPSIVVNSLSQSHFPERDLSAYST